MARKSELSVAKRREAVLALLRREEPGAQLARRYGVSEPTLFRWRDEFLSAGEAAQSRKSHVRLRAELAEARGEISLLEEELRLIFWKKSCV